MLKNQVWKNINFVCNYRKLNRNLNSSVVSAASTAGDKPFHNGNGAEKERIFLGPVVQNIVSLTSSLRVISLTILADSIYNILIFFAGKM